VTLCEIFLTLFAEENSFFKIWDIKFFFYMMGPFVRGCLVTGLFCDGSLCEWALM
jgi:hypothetical protein